MSTARLAIASPWQGRKWRENFGCTDLIALYPVHSYFDCVYTLKLFRILSITHSIHRSGQCATSSSAAMRELEKCASVEYRKMNLKTALIVRL
jgi:hypothetical protein